ncbi:MAG: 4,5-DOPA dioxygenase extradiol [Pseudomonadota bacterium]
MTATPALMPALFIGHGSPMNAMAGNRFTRGWSDIAAALPRPRAILAISAHWYTRGTSLTGQAMPPTLHDFHGFPSALSEIQYGAPGDTELAAELATELAPFGAHVRDDWGIDHGTWSVLVHMYPNADIPVLQLSIDAMRPPLYHYELGRALRPLRERGILVLGSGGIVHNLQRLDWTNSLPPAVWAAEFDELVKAKILASKDAALIDYPALGESAQLSVPSPDHYLPLLYVLGSRAPGEAASIPLTGFDLGTISMTAVKLAGA